MKIKFAFILSFLFSVVLLQAQPYWETYIHNKFVCENIFLKQPVDSSVPPTFESARNLLPEPMWDARPDVMKCYWKTWEIAYSNLHAVEPKSGFVYPLIDAAFNGDIYMWDSSFMLMFLKYALSHLTFCRH